MSTAYCVVRGEYFCRDCADGTEEVGEAFAAWAYYFRYRSPWTRSWHPALDRLEFENAHPHQTGARSAGADPAVVVAQDTGASGPPQQACDPDAMDDGRVRDLWDANAKPWDAGFDADGDEHRKYHTDEYMLRMLPSIEGCDVLDVGCGNGYLSRKLATMGARVTGVELSPAMLATAQEYESHAPLDITYVGSSASEMPMLAPASFHGIVQNHLLSSVTDHLGALREAHRVLRPDGWLSVVLSHPCFSCGPREWIRPVPGSPRPEEAVAFAVDGYFRSGPHLWDAWEGFSPIPYFHRTLSDYWQAFQVTGFRVENFVEPSVSERGRVELTPWRVQQAERIPYSCIFHLSKVDDPS
ncbi:MAG: class I SAM-dependent methyltransferase [Umezawaea sp.]